MAITGYNSVKKYAPASSTYPYEFTVSFEETGTSKENNTSSISASCSIYGKNISFTGSSTMYLYWFDNNENSNGKLLTSKSISSTSLKQTITINGTVTAKHKADGSLNGYARMFFDKVSGSYVPPDTTLETPNTPLTKIPRATKCPSGTFYIETIKEMVLSPAVDSYTHKLAFKIGSKSFNLNSNINANNKITIDLNDTSLYNEFTTEKTEVAVTLSTYYGSTLIGTDTNKIVIACDRNICKPTLAATIEDINPDTLAVTQDSNIIVKYKSHVKLNMNATAKNISIAKYYVNGNLVDDHIFYDNKPLNSSYKIQVYDSRNIPSDEVVVEAVGFADYLPVSLSVQTVRNTSTDGKVKAILSGKYYNKQIKAETEYGGLFLDNTFQLSYRYKEHESNTWSADKVLTGVTPGETFESTILLPDTFNYKKSFDFEFIATDVFSDDKKGASVYKGEPCSFENDDWFVFNNTPINKYRNPLASYPIGAIYLSTVEINPDEILGGRWQRLKDRFLLAAGDTYSAGSTGGSATHSHTSPNHSHGDGDMVAGMNFGKNTVYYNYSDHSGISSNWKGTMTYSEARNTTSLSGGVKVTGTTGATSVTTNSSSSMPPYVAVYVWERIE